MRNQQGKSIFEKISFWLESGKCAMENAEKYEKLEENVIFGKKLQKVLKNTKLVKN